MSRKVISNYDFDILFSISKPLRRNNLPYLLIPLFIVAVVEGWAPITTDYLDPNAYVQRSLRIAAAPGPVEFVERLFGTVDPPLRYLPLALVYAVTSPESLAVAERIGKLVQYLTVLVACPVTLYLLFSRVLDRRAGFISLGVFTAMTFSTVGGRGIVGVSDNMFRMWQADSPMPFVYLGLLAAYYAVAAEGQQSRYKSSAAVGVLTGIVVMIEPYFAVFNVAAISLAMLYNRRIREWLLTGVVGSISLTPLLFASEELWSRMAEDPYQDTYGAWIWGLIDFLQSPRALVLLAAFVVAMVAFARVGWPFDDRAVLAAPALVFTLSLLPLHVDYVVSSGWYLRRWGTAIVLVVAALLADQWLREYRRVDVAAYLPQSMVAKTVSSAALTVALILFAPLP